MRDVDRRSFSGPSVGAILLAAGGSTRLGRPKQLLTYRGHTLVRHAAEQAIASRARPLIAVLGADEERCRQELAGLDVLIARNAEWADGMGSSIRTGIAALSAHAPDADAAIILLCDQPLVTGAVLDRLIDRFAADPASTVAADYAGQPGVPAIFPRACFGDLARLDGAGGAKHLLRGSATPVIVVSCPEAAVDIDTLADYDRLLHTATGSHAAAEPRAPVGPRD